MKSIKSMIAPLIDIVQRQGKRSALALFACTVLVTQAACVSNISSQVKESDKDTSGVHDGVWLVQVKKSAGRQYMPGNWVVNCDGSPREFSFNVKNGIAQIRHYGKLKTTYVAKDGDFRFELPISDSNRVGKDGQLALKGRSLVFYGNLANTKGRYTLAYDEFGGSGCTAVTEFVRRS